MKKPRVTKPYVMPVSITVFIYTYIGSHGGDFFRHSHTGIGTPPDTLEGLLVTAQAYIDGLAALEYLAARASRNAAPSFMGFHTYFHGTAVIGGDNVMRTILFDGTGGPVYTPPDDDSPDDDVASRLDSNAVRLRYQYALTSGEIEGVVRYDENTDHYTSGCSRVSSPPIPPS